MPKLRIAVLTDNSGLGAVILGRGRATTGVDHGDEVVLSVICPLAAPVDVGRYCTCSVTACVGFRVTGKLPPTIAKPVPVIAAEFTVTGDVPVEVRSEERGVGKESRSRGSPNH